MRRRPGAAAVREVLAIAAAERTPAQIDAVFSYWRTTVPEWSEANQRIEALWRQHPAGTTQLALAARSSRGRRSCLNAAIFSSPPAGSSRARRRFCTRCETKHPTRLDFARWLVEPPLADRGPVGRQSDLASIFRHGAGGARAKILGCKAKPLRTPICSIG